MWGEGTATTYGSVDATYYEYCLDLTMRCQVTTHKEMGTEVFWWHMFFVGGFDVDTSADVTTEIDCEGDYAMTMTHHGSFGPRAVTVVHGNDGVEEHCEYLGTGPTQEASCRTEHTREWEAHETIRGRVDPDSLGEVCTPWVVINEAGLPLRGVLDNVDQAEVCFPLQKITSWRLT